MIFINLILLRHGQSTSNRDKIFTGWLDAPLTEVGVIQARNAGKLLKDFNVCIDEVHTSFLSRAIQTSFYTLDELGELDIPIKIYWRLNERNYGDLQGKNKDDIKSEFGEEQLQIWRRSFDVRPPSKKKQDNLCRPYINISEDIPNTSESLSDVLERMKPYIEKDLIFQLRKGKTILVSAHEHTLRALTMYFENLNPEDMLSIDIPNAEPILYKIDDTFTIVDKVLLQSFK